MLVEYDERGSIINDYYLYIGNIYIYIYAKRGLRDT